MEEQDWPELRPHVCAVNLLLDSPAQVTQDMLFEAIKDVADVHTVEADNSDSLMFTFPEYRSQLKDGEVPMAMTFTALPQPAEPSMEIISQSWDFPGAAEAEARAKARLACIDVLAGGVDPKRRLALIHDVLKAVMAIVDCYALEWPTAQRVVDKGMYLESKEGEHADLLYPAVNVRMFNPEGGAPNESLMDTLGLHIFGYLDLQVHYVDLPPNEVAGLLYNYAHYIFDNGNIINDGNTLQGLDPAQKWIARHWVSLAPPERPVLHIIPNEQFLPPEH